MQKTSLSRNIDNKFATSQYLDGGERKDNFFDVKTSDLTKLKILIIDNNPIISEGLRVCLEKYERTWSIRTCDGEKSNILLNIDYRPKIILIGATVNVKNVLQILDNIYTLEDFPKTIIMCERAEEYNNISKIIPDSVMSIIEYYSDISIYKSAIKAVSSGNRFYSPSILKLMFPKKKSTKPIDTTYNLTKRELEILKHISNGMSSKEIAHHYELSVRTVETHRQNIRQKTKVKGLRELIQIAKGMGLDKANF